MNPPPPGPATNGMVTPSVLAVATAASMALPPRFSASMPAWLASWSMDATAPPVPTATGSLARPAETWPAEARAPDGRATRSAARANPADSAGKRRMSTSAVVVADEKDAVRMLDTGPLKHLRPGAVAQATSPMWPGRRTPLQGDGPGLPLTPGWSAEASPAPAPRGDSD